MMKYDDSYFASRYNFFTDCVEWYFLPKTEIKVFMKKMDIRGFGWRPSIYCLKMQYSVQLREGVHLNCDCTLLCQDCGIIVNTDNC